MRDWCPKCNAMVLVNSTIDHERGSRTSFCYQCAAILDVAPLAKPAEDAKAGRRRAQRMARAHEPDWRGTMNARDIQPANQEIPDPPLPGLTIRCNEDGTLDELYAKASIVHIEQMDDNSWWMGITLESGEIVHMWIGAARAKVYAKVTMVDAVVT